MADYDDKLEYCKSIKTIDPKYYEEHKAEIDAMEIEAIKARQAAVVVGDEVSKDAENKSMWVFVLMLFGFYFVLYAVNYFFYYLTTVFVFERESFFGVSFTGLLIAFLVYTITISNVCNRISPTKNRGTFALIVIAFMIVDVILAVSAKQQLIHPIFISLGAQHRLFMMLLILFSGSKKWTSGHNNTTEPSSS